MSALMIYSQMNELQTAAQALHASGFWQDVKSQAQAMVKVMAGAELGLPPFASMTGIHIVQGKPVIGANVIATLVKNSGRYDYRVKRADAQACIITWYENGQPVGESGFTIEEAQTAGLTGKSTWKSYASDMLFARAISRGARRFSPGIFGGSPVYTPDEMGVAMDENGYVEAEIIVGEPAPANGHAQPAGPLYQYQDGSVVNDKAIDVYLEYVAAHNGNAPANVHNLRNWYKTQRQVEQVEPVKPVVDEAAQDELLPAEFVDPA